MEINSPPPPEVRGARVGCLLHRNYDAFVLAENGGKVVQNTHLHEATRDQCKKLNATRERCEKMKHSLFYVDVITLYARLHAGEIDGLVMDKYTLAHWTTVVALLPEMLENDEIVLSSRLRDEIPTKLSFFQQTITTPVEYEGKQQFTYGALVRDYQDYLFLKDAVKENRFRVHTSLSMLWNEHVGNFSREQKKDSLFSYQGSAFRLSAFMIAGVMVIIICVGLLFDFYRTKGDVSKLLIDCDSENEEEDDSRWKWHWMVGTEEENMGRWEWH